MAGNRYITESQIEEILDEVIKLFFIPKFDSYGMNATGEWKKNVEAIGSSIWGRDYTEQLAYGRKPGSFVPIAPLQKWAMAKFGMDEQSALGMAFAVSKNIQKNGTTWYQKGGTDLLSILDTAPVINFINKKVAKIVTNLVKTELEAELTKIFR